MSDDPSILLLDAATGTELTRRGVDTHGPAWSAPAIVRSPDVLAAIHADQVGAGADIITANTFRTQRRVLSRIGEARRAREWTIAAVRIARDAVEQAADERGNERPGAAPVRVAGSIAPLDDVDRPELAPDEATARVEHNEHVGHLAEARVDLLLVEAMTTIAESRAATSAALGSGLETWSAVTLDRSGGSLLSGEPLDAWVEAIAPLRPAAILVSGWPDVLAPALTRIAMLAPDIGARPGAYATLGSDTALASGGSGTDNDPAVYAETAKGLVAAGARIVGGGRGTTPAHTRALRAVLDEHLAAERLTAAQGDAAWRELVGRAGAMAGGGRALIVSGGDGAPREDLNEFLGRYELDRAAAGGVNLLPEGAFRLALVDTSAATAARSGLLRRVSTALEPGGWLAARIATEADSSSTGDFRLEILGMAGLEIRELATDGESTTLLARRPT
jgi:S-methylmethionine-dependent homocysteine/selenocysteine methylase